MKTNYLQHSAFADPLLNAIKIKKALLHFLITPQSFACLRAE